MEDGIKIKELECERFGVRCFSLRFISNSGQHYGWWCGLSLVSFYGMINVQE